MEEKKKEVLKGPAELETESGEPLFDLTNAATVMECTGLIQVPPESEEELENYAEVYSFSRTEPAVSESKEIKEEEVDIVGEKGYEHNR